MTTTEMADALSILLADDRDEVNPTNVRTFAEANLITMDVGVVVELDDGTEFQITIARSR